MSLRTPTKEAEEIRPSTFKKILEQKYGPEWFELEDETISLDMALQLTPLMLDKINMLRILVLKPELFFEDALFFLHCVDVSNNKSPDFEHFPSPNSLEIAWAIDEMSRIVEGEYSFDIKTTVTALLKREGYSNAPGTLLNVCYPDKLEPGQESEDRANKESAVAQYIAHMRESK